MVWDMIIMGWYLFYDYLQYYNFFLCILIYVGVCEVVNINCCMLGFYCGVDGIKIGYICVVGFNFVVFVECGSEWIIVMVFGGCFMVMWNV